MTTALSAASAEVRSAEPSANFHTLTTLALEDTDRYAYVYFPRPFPLGAQILSAELVLVTANAWSGANTLTARRVTTSWNESTIRYGAQPSNTATNAASDVFTDVASGQAITLDVQDMMQDVADGAGTFFGVRLSVNTGTIRKVHSTKAAAAFRPVLNITWTVVPEPPDQLKPDVQVVSHGSPRLRWRFRDVDRDGAQSASQVQVATDEAFGGGDIVYDTGKEANLSSSWNLANDVGWDPLDLPDGASLFWRVKAWDNTDFASDWSAAAALTRNDLGTLELSDPSGTVNDTTPTFTWTFTGETQTSYYFALQRKAPLGYYVNIWTESAASTADELTVPSGLIVTGETYRAELVVTDTHNRDGMGSNVHATDTTADFVYVRDGSPDGPSTLTAEAAANSPEVELTWERSSPPDYWCLVVDGVEVLDRIDVSDTFVSGTTYSLSYWLATPREEHTFEIEAVVSDGGTYEHSNGNPTATATINPVGIWLADPDDGTAVQILGREEVSAPLSESATTYDVIGSQVPVRITDVVRGYVGSVSGTLDGAEARDTFYELKGRLKELHLVFGDVAIPVILGRVSAVPTPVPGDLLYSASLEFFQCGPPWPVSDV